MAGRNIKVCILRARHDPTVPTISEQACLEMLMIGEGSVFRYWTDVTGGFLDFIDSTLQPWVDISVGPEEPREKSAEKAFQATKDAGGVLGGFDVFMVLLHPGTYVVPNPMAGQPGQLPTLTKGQPGGAGFLLQGKQGCTLPVMTGTQTFFCHELGHTFGFEHSYGVLNNGSDWDGIAPFTLNPVYGDPYDLMSSETFGARWLDPSAPKYGGHPTFTEAVPNGWPSQTGAQRGPMISRSHMMVWDARSMPTEKVRRFTYPMTGEVINVRLGTASRSTTDPTLIELHPPSEALFPGGTFFCSLELRTRNGWDRGLKLSGTDPSRQDAKSFTADVVARSANRTAPSRSLARRPSSASAR
jgi:hypothetical protein